MLMTRNLHNHIGPSFLCTKSSVFLKRIYIKETHSDVNVSKRAALCEGISAHWMNFGHM